MAKSFDELAKRTMTHASRARAARRTRQILAEMLLGEIRKQVGRSQSQLARILGIKQPTLSKLESQDDMQISTLKRIIEALGGKVEIVARFPTQAIRLRQFQEPLAKASSTSTKKAGAAKRTSKAA